MPILIKVKCSLGVYETIVHSTTCFFMQEEVQKTIEKDIEI